MSEGVQLSSFCKRLSKNSIHYCTSDPRATTSRTRATAEICSASRSRVTPPRRPGTCCLEEANTRTRDILLCNQIEIYNLQFFFAFLNVELIDQWTNSPIYPIKFIELVLKTIDKVREGINKKIVTFVIRSVSKN